MYLLGGQGYTIRAEYSFTEFYHYSAKNHLYPNGPIRIYWGANYYDKTDLIFYVIIVPLGIYALIKLYSIYKSKKSA